MSAAAYDPFAGSGDPNLGIGGAPPGTQPIGDVQEWYRKLVTTNSGILYEDAYLQVTPQISTSNKILRREFEESTSRISGNASHGGYMNRNLARLRLDFHTQPTCTWSP